MFSFNEKETSLADTFDISFQHVHRGLDLLMDLGDVLNVTRVSYNRNM